MTTLFNTSGQLVCLDEAHVRLYSGKTVLLDQVADELNAARIRSHLQPLMHTLQVKAPEFTLCFSLCTET